MSRFFNNAVAVPTFYQTSKGATINIMEVLKRITFDPNQFGGKPCIRGLRITVGTVLTLLRDHSREEILNDYPELEAEDIDAALAYGAYLAEERDVLVA